MAFPLAVLEEALLAAEVAEAAEASPMVADSAMYESVVSRWRIFEANNPRIATAIKAKAIGVPISYVTVDRLISNDWWKHRGDTVVGGLPVGAVLKYIPDEFHWNAPTVWDAYNYFAAYEDSSRPSVGPKRRPDRYEPYPSAPRRHPDRVFPVEREDWFDQSMMSDGRGRKRKADEFDATLASAIVANAASKAAKRVRRTTRPNVIGTTSGVHVLYRHMPYTVVVKKNQDTDGMNMQWAPEFVGTVGPTQNQTNTVGAAWSTTAGIAKYFSAEEIPDFSNWKGRFEQYRVAEIRVGFISQTSQGYASGGNATRMGMLAAAPDMNDNNVEVLEKLTQKAGFRFLMDSSKTSYMTFKPHAYQSGIETLIPGGWLNTLNGGQPHFGLKIAPVNQTHTNGATYVYSFMFRIKLEFRNPK